MFNRSLVAATLEKLSGNTFIGLTTETNVKLTGGKKNEMQGRVTKRTVSNVSVFQNKTTNAYENKRLKADADFVLSPRAWGERVQGTPFVTHKGKDYLEVIFNSVASVEYFLDGEPVAKGDIEGLPAPRPSKAEEAGVVIRTYGLDSIREIRAFGNEVKA